MITQGLHKILIKSKLSEPLLQKLADLRCKVNMKIIKYFKFWRKGAKLENIKSVSYFKHNRNFVLNIKIVKQKTRKGYNF